MPRFTDHKPPPPSRDKPRAEGRAEPRLEPPGLDAFAALAGVTPPPDAGGPDGHRRGRGRALPASPMPVRFPADVKAALERLSERDQRSQQQILERVAFPAILEAARLLP